MMKRFRDFLHFIYKNKEHTLIFFMIILVVLFLWKCCSTKSLKDKNAILKQNIEASTEKFATVLKNKEGEYYTSKKSYMFTIKELKRLNEELADETVKYKGLLANLQKVNISYSNDTTKLIYDTVFISDFGKFYKSNWFLKDDLLFLDGLTEIFLEKDSLLNKVRVKTNSKIINYNIELDVYSGILKEDGIWKTFVRSDNERIKFNIVSNLNPEIFMAKRKTFTFGPTIGLGIGLAGKDFQKPLSQLDIRPVVFVGVGFTYNLFSF